MWRHFCYPFCCLFVLKNLNKVFGLLSHEIKWVDLFGHSVKYFLILLHEFSHLEFHNLLIAEVFLCIDFNVSEFFQSFCDLGKFLLDFFFYWILYLFNFFRNLPIKIWGQSLIFQGFQELFVFDSCQLMPLSVEINRYLS